MYGDGGFWFTQPVGVNYGALALRRPNYGILGGRPGGTASRAYDRCDVKKLQRKVAKIDQQLAHLHLRRRRTRLPARIRRVNADIERLVRMRQTLTSRLGECAPTIGVSPLSAERARQVGTMGPTPAGHRMGKPIVTQPLGPAYRETPAYMSDAQAELVAEDIPTGAEEVVEAADVVIIQNGNGNGEILPINGEGFVPPVPDALSQLTDLDLDQGFFEENKDLIMLVGGSAVLWFLLRRFFR